MTNKDAQFTKLLAAHLINAKGFYDYGLNNGLVDREDLRLTIDKRRETAQKLIEGGMSRRKAAAALDVSPRQLRRDLGQNAPESGAKSPTPSNGQTTRELLSQSDQNDWRTPRKYLEAARKVMGEIDLDPATSAAANETVGAKTFYTEKEDGLQQPWKGTVWLNPPYGGNARLFVERLIREYEVGNVTAACALLNSHPTETKWFQKLFDYTICFVAGRIDFGGPSRAVSTTSTHGSAIAYLGKKEAVFATAFSKFGSVVRRVQS